MFAASNRPSCPRPTSEEEEEEEDEEEEMRFNNRIINLLIGRVGAREGCGGRGKIVAAHLHTRNPRPCESPTGTIRLFTTVPSFFVGNFQNGNGGRPLTTF